MRLREPEVRAEPGLLTSRVKSDIRAGGFPCSSICSLHLSSQGAGCGLLGPEPAAGPSLTCLSPFLSRGLPSVLPPWTVTPLLGNLGVQGNLPCSGWSGASAPEPRRAWLELECT